MRDLHASQVYQRDNCVYKCNSRHDQGVDPVGFHCLAVIIGFDSYLRRRRLLRRHGLLRRRRLPGLSDNKCGACKKCQQNDHCPYPAAGILLPAVGGGLILLRPEQVDEADVGRRLLKLFHGHIIKPGFSGVDAAVTAETQRDYKGILIDPCHSVQLGIFPIGAGAADILCGIEQPFDGQVGAFIVLTCVFGLHPAAQPVIRRRLDLYLLLESRIIRGFVDDAYTTRSVDASAVLDAEYPYSRPGTAYPEMRRIAVAFFESRI